MRPQQWFKNFFIFAALIFAYKFNELDKVLITFAAFFLFCFASSAVYLLNDIIDLPRDRNHPLKRNRPLAAGKISIYFVGAAAAILGIGASTLSFCLGIYFGCAVLAYIIFNIAYSLILKHLVIIDVITIALGFVIRVIGGALAIGVVFSPWLLLCTFFLTLFLAISKRKNELLFSSHYDMRPVLSSYSIGFIEKMNVIILPITLISYTLYTFSTWHSPLFIATVPVVSYGLFRYLFILDKKIISDDGPSADFLKDKALQITVFIWIVVVIAILYYER